MLISMGGVANNIMPHIMPGYMYFFAESGYQFNFNEFHLFHRAANDATKVILLSMEIGLPAGAR